MRDCGRIERWSGKTLNARLFAQPLTLTDLASKLPEMDNAAVPLARKDIIQEYTSGVVAPESSKEAGGRIISDFQNIGSLFTVCRS
jgi:hypothetical protein